MAYQRDIVAADKVFFDTDRILSYEIFAREVTEEEQAALEAEAAGGDPVLTIPMQDVSGWELAWTLRKQPKTAAALIEKTTGAGITIVGVFNASRALNTQRVEVLIEDTDTYDPSVSPQVYVKPSTSYAYGLKRTDEGQESILAWGGFTLLQAAPWE
jgi:hypothetical protein